MALVQITSTVSVNATRVLDVGINSDNDTVITLHYDGGTRTITASNVTVADATTKINARAYPARR
tara:strand:- start:33821 stop:34015 length:195 start_codon:yes stop_codon:yes gene_type:complete